MKEHFDVVVVMPLGPGSSLEFILDTLESFTYYSSCTHKFILADDSQKGTGFEVQKVYPTAHVITVTKNLGKSGGLYVNLSNAYRFAIENYSFEALLRLDDDALITGKDPEAAAIRMFRDNPHIGMAGRHLTRQLSVDSTGHVHDNYWPRKQLLKDTCSWKIIRRPISNLLLRKIFFQAVQNGYELGENIFGGAYFISEKCLIKLNEAGYLPNHTLKKVNLEEDHLFSLLSVAVGFRLGDLASGDLPFGCAWRGLPTSPEQLHEKGKKIIHSTRSWQHMKEKDIRGYFRQWRQA